MKSIRALMTLALVALLTPAAGTAATLPAMDATEIRAGATLLTQTFYHELDRGRVLADTRTALLAYVHAHGAPHATIAAPPRVRSDGALAQALIDEVQEAFRDGSFSDKDLTYVALDAMAKAAGDRYTQFFTPDQYKAFRQPLQPGKISGIGVIFGIDEVTKDAQVLYVVPDAPAERAGLQSGDRIMAVDNTPTRGLPMDRISALLRGPRGTAVQLRLARDGTALEPLTIVRSDVRTPTVFAKMLPGNVGYLFVSIFGGPTSVEFTHALAKLQSEGAKGYVIDLRNNGGGYVDAAVQISSNFIDRTPVVSVEEHGAQMTTYDAHASGPVITAPLTILVNGYTASASEITAAALRESGVATLVGTRTYGKGVVQTLTPFPDGSAIKITTARYLTPQKHDIDSIGLVPDVTVEENSGARLGQVDSDAQLRAALEALAKKLATL